MFCKVKFVIDNDMQKFYGDTALDGDIFTFKLGSILGVPRDIK